VSVNEKVKDGTIVNDMSSGVTNLASKMQSMSVKGWQGFSSMFSDGPKSDLQTVDGGPGEQTSLLATGGTGKREYGDPQKPLLHSSPGREKEDGWASWGDEWAESPSPTSKEKEKEKDDWGNWSNEASSPQSTVSQSLSDETWSNDWGSSTDGFSQGSNTTATAANGNNTSKNKKNRQNQKKEAKASRASAEAAATANLIDFGAEESNGQVATGDGWDDSGWGADDGWQTLELSNSSASKPKDRSKKGD